MRPRRSRRIPAGERPELVAVRPGHVWCMDFAHDSYACGTKLKVLALVDEASRECLALHVARRIPGEALVEALKAAIAEHGRPECIRCDNGPEFTCWALKLFLEDEGIRHVLIQPGSPWQNGYAESFVGTFRSECLDTELFQNLADAQLRIALWRKFYNHDRPHSSLGYLEPHTFREKWNELSLQKQTESVV